MRCFTIGLICNCINSYLSLDINVDYSWCIEERLIKFQDEPPKVSEIPHPKRAGADKDTRQCCMDTLYKVTRQLTKPGLSYSWAYNKVCLLYLIKIIFILSLKNLLRCSNPSWQPKTCMGPVHNGYNNFFWVISSIFKFCLGG